MSALTLQFLGPWQVTLPDGSGADLKYDKVRAMLAILAVQSRQAHQREMLAAHLWPELPRLAAMNNVRQALHTLRQAIGDRDADPPYLLITRAAVQLNPHSNHDLDVARFTDAISFSRHHAHRNALSCQTCAGRLEEAVALFRGPFLTDLSLPDSIPFEEWALLHRERLNDLMLDALTRLLIFHQRRGDYDRAAEFAQRQLVLEPWREQAHRALMRLHMLRDRRSAALAQYETCRRLLREELAVDPEDRTTRLYHQIRDAADAGDQALAFLESSVDPPFHVPLPPTPFVGRQAELQDVARLLDDAACRLITVTGPGGVGKTRLAIQAAADQMNLFADGIYFVSIEAVKDASQLPALIAGALPGGMLSQAPATVVDAPSLARALRKKELLLVLDNFDHLVEQALFLEPLLRLAPDVNVLVTSRQRLNLRAEWVYPLSGFDIPAAAESATTPTAQVDPALQLFESCARRVSADFRLSSTNAAHAARICRLLDGLPLGIELAAGWTAALSLPEIAGEIERGVRFLTARQHDLPDRHRSLWAILSQSWQRLSAQEQSVLAQLAVFEGAFPRAAAQCVTGADLSTLAALVDKSLLQRRPPHRYALHSLLRQYAAQQLRELSSVDHQARNRHLQYYLHEAEATAGAADEDAQVLGMQQLAAQYDNLRAALSWACHSDAIESGLRLASALYRFWYWRSHFHEGSSWLTTFLESAGEASDLAPSLHASALYANGVLLAQQDRHDEAYQNLQRSLSLRRALNDEAGQAACLNSLGIIAWRREAYDGAAALLQESLSLRRRLGDANIGPPLNNLGLVALAQGRYDRAQAYFLDLLRHERLNGQDMGVAIALSNLAVAVLQGGRPDEAHLFLREGAALFQKLEDREGLAGCLETAAAIAVAQSTHETAARLCAAAAALRRHIHAPLTAAERARYEDTVAAAQSALDAPAFDKAWREGASMSLPHALQLLTPP